MKLFNPIINSRFSSFIDSELIDSKYSTSDSVHDSVRNLSCTNLSLSNSSFVLNHSLPVVDFDADIKIVTQKIHDLYLTNRSKFLLQTNSGYIHVHKTLSNNMIQNHLKKSVTLGVFAGAVYSKFICFDVDLNEGSIDTAKEIYNCLLSIFKIDDKAIMISKSGLKGYHVEVFFDKPVEVSKLKYLYNYVLTILGLKADKVEFRPTFNQGVKLPFSINKKNQVSCDVVDKSSFEILDTKKGLHPTLDVIPHNSNKLFNPTTKRKISFSNNISIPHLFRNVEDFSEIFEKNLTDSQKNAIVSSNINGLDLNNSQYLTNVITTGYLLDKNTRHSLSIKLLNHFAFEYQSKIIAIEKTKEIIRNTFTYNPKAFNKDTTLKFALDEVDRLSTYISVNSELKFEIEYLPQLTKNEIEFILKPSSIKHKSYLLALFLHWARLGFKDSFFMTYQQLSTSLGLAYDSGHIKKQKKILLDLQNQNLIRIIKHNYCFNGEKKKPNIYKIMFTAEEGRKLLEKLDIKNINDLIKELPKLFNEEEIKELVSKNEYYRYFKKAFED